MIMKKARKNDKGKPGFHNIPRLALLEVAKVMTAGALEYGQYNYSGKIKVTRLTSASERHNNKFLTHQDIDESGFHHIAHVIANNLMLLDNILTGNIIDDRNPVYKTKPKKKRK